MPSNQPIFDTIIKLFTQENWSFTQIKKQSALRLSFKGKNAKCDCYAQVREQEKQFIFYSVCPERVPKTKRRVLGEFLLRINYQQIIGSFDLDFSDGEVRYKTSMSINNYSLTPAIILIRGVGGGEYVALFE